MSPDVELDLSLELELQKAKNEAKELDVREKEAIHGIMMKESADDAMRQSKIVDDKIGVVMVEVVIVGALGRDILNCLRDAPPNKGTVRGGYTAEDISKELKRKITQVHEGVVRLRTAGLVRCDHRCRKIPSIKFHLTRLGEKFVGDEKHIVANGSFTHVWRKCRDYEEDVLKKLANLQ